MATKTDVAFLTAMIEHHTSALTMSKDYLKDSTAASDPRVVDLANNIIKAQTDEIAKMKSWISDAGTKAAVGKAEALRRYPMGEMKM